MPSDDGKTTMGEFVDILPKDGDYHRFSIDGHTFEAAYFGEMSYDDTGSWGKSERLAYSSPEHRDGTADGS